ncbi:Uncharacterized protein TCM_005263 [Theobroma cacao]|uniref:Uncharacterized protein n=1 Tax=Theobroma cacao TaxID=3641 RepID=A0A061DT12_THECC|nr:Uncharacterized protein TCM_005263 [Theobroma cacao]
MGKKKYGKGGSMAWLISLIYSQGSKEMFQALGATIVLHNFALPWSYHQLLEKHYLTLPSPPKNEIGKKTKYGDRFNTAAMY